MNYRHFLLVVMRMIIFLKINVRIKNLTGITSNGLCIGCGLCQSVVGKEKIHISMTDKGRLEPRETVSLY